ncbi:SAC3/GANP/Nin1/mts3/eIF-3 p25 family-domain-containing protein [Lipomyces oligophaga]|uniref:SAC3/GANP/Nin1/mts3/eIF-3 p25 family-domain-containing protein n=1 Tax=Lipomyces oligophaga TaxID=45792 RepID=UPI0034CF1609
MSSSKGKTAFGKVKISKSLNKKTGSVDEKSSTASSPAPTQWPDSLKNFVGRCFTLIDPSQRGVLEKNLKDLITEAMQSDSLWSTDWDNHPLPINIPGQDKEFEKSRTIKNSDMKNNAESDSQEIDMTNRQDISNSTRSKRIGRWDQLPKELEENKSIEPIVLPKKKKTKQNSSDERLTQDVERKAKRAQRFERQSVTPNRNSYSPPSELLYIQDAEPEEFVGRSQTLEKRYLRLTSAPDPETVRPLYILHQTLELLKHKWSQEQNYAYICDQFKSMRQDLTVQHIRNEFTVNVYEIHARIALERSDLGEYNQCQTQLRALYSMGIPGHPVEFLAYRILYLLHTRNRSDLNDVLIELTDSEKADPAVTHALAVQQALMERDYHTFMKLYLTAPNMGGYVMDSFIGRERLMALEIICKAFRPSIGLNYVITELVFETEEAAIEFLVRNKLLQYYDEQTRRLNTKDAYPTVQFVRMSAYKKIDIKGQI